MSRIYDLVPKDKCDNSNIEKLKQLTDEEIAPILPALLEWIQDGNWPVATDIASVLVLHQSAVIPLIINVLKPEAKDEMWKYWIITGLMPRFFIENIVTILPSIKRIAENPTHSEKAEGIDEDAVVFIQEFSLKKL